MSTILVVLRVPVWILSAHWCLRRWVVWWVPEVVDEDLGAAPNFLFYLLYNIAFSILGNAVSQNDIMIFGSNYT